MKAEIVTFGDLKENDRFLWYPQGNTARVVTCLGTELRNTRVRVTLKDGKMTRRIVEARTSLVARLS